jgi:uncharacterized transporter YbjL
MREESAGKTVEQRRAELGKAAIALRVRRGKELLEADPNLELREGDVISLVSSLAVHQWARDTLAVEDVLDPELLDFHIDALSIVTEAARSSVPAIGYAGSYTFANVLLTFGGTMMML